MKKENLETKIVVCMMCQEEEDYIELSLRSVMNFADAIIVVDGGSKDNTLNIIDQLSDERFTILKNSYDKFDPGMDGKQRNVYLNHVKKYYEGWWCLVVDADEVVGDTGVLLRETLKTKDRQGYKVASPRMEHFIYDLNKVDATAEKHFCPCRIFKIEKGLSYPNIKHTILKINNEDFDTSYGFNCETITLFHLGYLRGIFKVMQRFRDNLNNSPIHDENFLNNWKSAHISGQYPVKKYFGPYPRTLRKYFGLVE